MLFLFPFTGSDFGFSVFERASLFFSGLINPLFLESVILVLVKPSRQLVLIAKVLFLLMMPFCWITFHYEGLHPREGYFLWILGMLLVLFSSNLVTVRSNSRHKQRIVPA